MVLAALMTIAILTVENRRLHSLRISRLGSMSVIGIYHQLTAS
jgi:hypothetical protein